jgi:putative hydrolase of the HAD superfamily
MGAGAVRGIIFDLGNVLVDFDHAIAAKRIAEFSGRSARDIYNMFFDSELTRNFESGKLLPLQFFAEVKEILNLKIGYEEFLPIWNEVFFLSEKNRLVYDLAKGLKQDYKIALLSNVNVLHMEYLKKNFPVFDAFHNVIASFEIGCTKPDPMIYKKTLQILGLPAESILYTDDRPELVEGARSLGIRGFVFKGFEQLRRDLIDSGINI